MHLFRNFFSSQFMHFSRQFLRDEKQFPPTHSLFGWLCYICNLNKFLSCIILLHFVTFVINIRLKLNLFDTFYKCCLELNLTNTFGSCVNIFIFETLSWRQCHRLKISVEMYILQVIFGTKTSSKMRVAPCKPACNVLSFPS